MSRNRSIVMEKWVTCLDCEQEYIVECIILDEAQEGCPVCGCKAYDESGQEWGDF